MVVAQAGTALSTRRRDEPNAFNLVTVDLPRLALETRAWDGGAFAPLAFTAYTRAGGGWLLEQQEAG
jgi:hypothetical protein